MEVKQIYELVNVATKESIGESAVLTEDLTNLVEVGDAIFDANAVDNYVRSLVNQIGKIVFVARKYSGRAPSVLMDGWEYGSVLEKVRFVMPEATENESWELQNGASYDPNIFYKPEVHTKFFNKEVTFEIPISITEKQVKESFQNATQMNSFVSGVFISVDNSMTIKLDKLIKMTIANFIGETIYDEYGGAALSSKSGVKAVNLLYLYNQEVDTPLTAAEAIHNREFIRFAVNAMSLGIEHIAEASVLYNIGGTLKFTPADKLHMVMLADFKAAATAYLSSDTFHDNYVALPNSETVSFWQGIGSDFSFTNASKIDVVTSEGNSVEAGGVLAIMFDRDALGVLRPDKKVTSGYNPKGDFYNYWHKHKSGYFNDFDENFVVYFVA